LQAVVFVAGKKGIPVWGGVGLDLTGVLLGVCFFVFSFISYRKQFSAERDVKELLWTWWKDIIIFLLCLTGMEYVPASLFMYVGFLSPAAAFVTGFVGFIVLAVLLIRATLVLVFDLQVEKALVSKKELYKKIRKYPLFLLATLGVFLWFAWGEVVLDFLFFTLAQALGNHFSLLVANEFSLAMGNALILVFYLEYATSLKTVIYEEGMIQRAENATQAKKVFLYVTTAIMVLGVSVDVIYQANTYKPLSVDEYIEELMNYAKTEAEFQRTAEAIHTYVKVEEYLEALGAFADENKEALAKAVSENKGDDFYWRLYYSFSDDIGMAKEALLESGIDTRLCHDILRFYHNAQSQIEEVALTEEENELIEDCLQISLSRGEFIDTTLKFHKDSLRNKTINDMKETYEETLMYNDIFLVLQESGMKGYVDSDTANRLLQLANEHPGNKAYQFLAIMGASGYLEDSANHYGQLMECAKRLDSLMKQDCKDMSLLVEEKLYLAQIAMDCRDYKTAAEFLEDVGSLGNTEVEDTIIFCYLELQENEKALAYVEELRKKGSDTALLDYMAALSNLKMQNVEKALENGVFLAEKVSQGGEDREKNNALLYSLAEYLCINDSYKDYIDYHYRVTAYTEEQMAILNKSELLKNYVDTMNAVYNTKDMESALKALDSIEMAEPDLSTTWFLRGTVYFDNLKYDEAIESFKKCLSLDEKNTTATYCLAVLYDIKEDYEASARMCEQILNVMPTVNHEIDWYGIAYHTKALYEAILEYAGGTR